MSAYGLVVTVIVTIAIVVAILLFERRRAEDIKRDLGDQSAKHRRGRP